MASESASTLEAPFRLPEAPGRSDLVAKYFRGRILELLRDEGELSVGELVGRPGRSLYSPPLPISYGGAPTAKEVEVSRESPLVEVRYFDGCPNHGSAVALIERVANDLGIPREGRRDAHADRCVRAAARSDR